MSPETDPAVLEHPLEVGNEEPLVLVVVPLQPLTHRLQVHRELDVLVVVRYNLGEKKSHTNLGEIF